MWGRREEAQGLYVGRGGPNKQSDKRRKVLPMVNSAIQLLLSGKLRFQQKILTFHNQMHLQCSQCYYNTGNKNPEGCSVRVEVRDALQPWLSAILGQTQRLGCCSFNGQEERERDGRQEGSQAKDKPPNFVRRRQSTQYITLQSLAGSTATTVQQFSKESQP